MTNEYQSIINERINHYGVTTLMDEEVICGLTGIPVLKVRQYIESYGLNELIKFSKGLDLTPTQKKKLNLLYHAVKRINVSSFKEKEKLDTSSKAGAFFVKELQFLTEEHFLMALLDSQSRLIEKVTVFKGTINEATVYPREVVKTAIEKNAHSVILSHNHPGGSLTPSGADIELTKKVTTALMTINVGVLDHIIVSEDKYISLAENGLV